MPSEVVTVSADALTAFAAQLFQASRVPVSESHAIAESLVDANLRGHESHGVVRVMEYLGFLSEGAVKAGVSLDIVSRTASLVVCDGQLGFGQVQMRRLLDLLEPMARDTGLACGTIRRCGHIGRLGEWVERLARRNLAGLLSVNDNGVLTSVAPPGGKQPRISTNPIAIGVPSDSEPLVLDISTSIVANGKIRVAQIAGRQCPAGWILDSEGNPTTDPNLRFADPPGTILPMGGYKGFGLGLLLDILVGGLSGGYCPPAPSGEIECNNVMLIAFDPDRFAGLEHFRKQSQGLCEFARSSQPIHPDQKIRLPGDQSQQLMAQRRVTGIPLDEGTWNQLLQCAERLRVQTPSSL